MPLTDAWLRANNGKPRDSVLEKADSEGLSVRVSKTGKVVFQLRFRWLGKPARIDLGRYPQTALKEARAKRDEYKGALSEGVDPRQVKAEEVQQAQEAPTVEAAFRLWYENYCVKEKKAPEEVLRTFEIHVFPKLGNLRASEVSVYSWSTLLEELKDTKPSIALRILTNAKQMYRWLLRRGLCPTHGLLVINGKEDLRIEKGTRGRSLSETDLRYLFKSLQVSRAFPSNRAYVLMALMMGCRNGELRTMAPSDVDLDGGVWELPPEKNKVQVRVARSKVRPLRRPLLPEAVKIIEFCNGISTTPDRVFSASRYPGEMNDRTVLSFPTGLIKIVRERFNYDMPHWSLHDLRKTARTNFSKFTEPHVAEMMLGHSLKGVQGIYDYHDYLEEQRGAYRQWFDYLRELGAFTWLESY